MFCSNCGNKLSDDARFCDSCGTKVDVQPSEQPAADEPKTTYTASAPTPVTSSQPDADLNSLANTTMVLGIVGLALSEFGLPGLIVSNIGMKKAAEFQRRAGSFYGKAKVGRLLSKIGKIVGLVMTIFWAVYIVIFLIIYIAIITHLIESM